MFRVFASEEKDWTEIRQALNKYRGYERASQGPIIRRRVSAVKRIDQETMLVLGPVVYPKKGISASVQHPDSFENPLSTTEIDGGRCSELEQLLVDDVLADLEAVGYGPESVAFGNLKSEKLPLWVVVLVLLLVAIVFVLLVAAVLYGG